MVATRACRVVYLSVRAGVVTTQAYRVAQQQGYLGFEGSTRRDFAKPGGQAIKVMKGLVRCSNLYSHDSHWPIRDNSVRKEKE